MNIYINLQAGDFLNISAIIAEYNPLHNGHVYHIEQTKKITKADGLICVMSGNFVQRGQPSIIDKWLRTKLALLSGIDLVIELPALYSASSAEFFSYGAVSLLNNLNVVNSLCFGSEAGNIDYITYIADIFQNEPEEYTKALKQFVKEGLPFHSARSNALKQYIKINNKHMLTEYDFTEIIQSSNNILAIEYCKSLLKLQSKIKPYTIERQGASYNEENLTSSFPSATAIRAFVKGNKKLEGLKSGLPNASYTMLKTLKKNNYDFAYDNKIFQYIKYKSSTSKNLLENIPDASEGLGNKIYNAILQTKSFEELMTSIKSKRYSYTRLARILCQYFIGFENFNTSNLRKMPCPYGKILGFNNTGIQILKEIKKNSDFPIYTKLPKEKACDEMLKLDLQATRAYSSINSSINPYDDYYKCPQIITHNK